ncbi:ABC transporter substrate-binding protein [Actinomadura parmotrematis]|uniref:ABC transporter substrate-binding protein n=1 Tax=Actinomadura parmotrematis TaxID=2864039 RepID=A0ABS7FKS4_9ACTN|nr:ABC transporter substrate-binding protein [Actinomadura parmotrematis]MBW8480959.1 ABC transporter substrate-binding protein [Actinomadura parmotrematis]
MNPLFGRSRLLVAALAVGALSLTGCGDDAKDAAAPAPSATSRTVQATNGSVTVPANPKKVVGINYATGALLDVGVVPVGTTKIEEPLDLVPAQQAQGAKIPEIGAGDQINLEKVAALQPDLIIVEGADFGWPIDKLTKIAPTLYFEVTKPSELVGSAEKIAAAVGREAKTKELKAAYEKRLAEVKGKYATALQKKFTIVSTYGEGKFYIDTRTSWMGQVLNGLGAGFAKESDKTDTHENEYSQEKLSVLSDADVVLIGNSGGKFTPEVDKMLATPQWKLLKAARTGQVHGIDYSYADRYSTMSAVLDQIEKILQGLG